MGWNYSALAAVLASLAGLAGAEDVSVLDPLELSDPPEFSAADLLSPLSGNFFPPEGDL
jgi:hypothetical protein